MSQSKLVTESVYSDGHHSEINRMIAVCIDEGSAAYVFDWALHNMFDPKTDMVVLLNCRQLNAPENPFLINPSGFVPEVEDVKKIQSHHLLKEYAHKLKSHNIAMRAIALVGDPKVEIVKKVSELEADVLVMGTRQLGSFKRVLLGSTSDYVSHNSPCTTVIVRAYDPEAKHQKRNIFQRNTQENQSNTTVVAST